MIRPALWKNGNFEKRRRFDSGKEVSSLTVARKCREKRRTNAHDRDYPSEVCTRYLKVLYRIVRCIVSGSGCYLYWIIRNEKQGNVDGTSSTVVSWRIIHNGLPTSVTLYRDIPLCAETYRSVPRHTALYRDIPLCTETYRSVPRHTALCRDIPLCTETYRSVPRHTALYRDIPLCTETYRSSTISETPSI